MKIRTGDVEMRKDKLQEATKKIQAFAGKTGRSAIKVASTTGKWAKDGSEALGKAIGEAQFEMDRKLLRPVFPDELHSLATVASDITTVGKTRIASMIRIAERDKRRSESEACKGAVGYRMTVKGVELLNIYEDSAKQFGLWFHPNLSQTFYYSDHRQSNFYVSLDEYFAYLKNARVSELEMIAKDLGAKKIKIALKEKKKTFVAKKTKAEAKVPVKAKASGSYEREDSDYSSITIANETEFSGHDTPVMPDLVYFKNERDIQKLIEMRMDTSKQNEIKSKTYSLQYNKSAGIKEKEAAKIDAVLSQLKCSGTASVSSEAQYENRTILEYSIEF